MPIDPAINAVLTFMQQRRDDNRPTVTQARARLRSLTAGLRTPANLVEVHSTQDRTIPGNIAARIYRPATEKPTPTVVFFHGGGFVIGDLDTHDHLCRMICSKTAAVVMSVAYRLAPEHPFPAAIEDCVAATQWAADHPAELGGNPQRLAVAGDSAGANLAAVVAQICRDQGGPHLTAQLLVCPATDLDPNSYYRSRQDNATGYFLTAEDLQWFAQSYLDPDVDVTSPLCSPLRGNLNGLPPAVIVTAQYDPLRDEGEAYAQALKANGVPVTLHRFDGLIHGFFDFTSISRQSAQAVTTLCDTFHKQLNGINV